MSLRPSTVDPRGFRSALSSFASSVCVVTLWNSAGTALGMTATAFASVSINPLLILVCVNRAARIYGPILERSRFGVNILGAVSQEMSDFCARPDADKILEPSWLAPGNGWQSPALAGCLAFLDCQVEQSVPAGTHGVLIGEVQGIGLREEAHSETVDPLVYYRGRYRQLQGVINYSRPSPLPLVSEDLP